MTDLRPVPGQDGQARKGRLGRRALLYGAAAVPMLGLTGRRPAQGSGLRTFSARAVHSGHSLTDPLVSVLETRVAAAGQQKTRSRIIDRWHGLADNSNRPAGSPPMRVIAALIMAAVHDEIIWRGVGA